MPELPEVETIKNQLQVFFPFKITSEVTTPEFSSIQKTSYFELKGKTILRSCRKGKMLYFELDSDEILFCHLGMSGSWQISESKIQEKHTHLLLRGTYKNKQYYLGYIDPRRFGNMYLCTKDQSVFHFKKLGVDVSSSDFSVDILNDILKKFPNWEIKPFLMEQKYLSGVGNYMASEICALSGIRPTRKNKSIKKREISKIVESTKNVVNQAIEHQGTSFSGGYKDAFGSDGGGLVNLVVFYQKKCGLCKKTSVNKIYQKNRGSYFCPRCQK